MPTMDAAEAATAPATPGLAVRGLTVKYGATTAVRDVSFTVPSGSILALLGPSGCGKSSLLRALAGLEPASGSISFAGRELTGVPTHRRQIGMMFQDSQLFPARNLARNVAYGLRPAAASAREDQETYVAQMLERVGLAGMGERDVATLSGGQAQRGALARALAPQPRCLLFDEPLSALDRGLRTQMVETISALMRQMGTTGVYVTHDQDEAFAIGDIVAVMIDGEIVRMAPPRELWFNPGSVVVAKFLGYGPCYELEPGVTQALAPGALTIRPEAAAPAVGDATATVTWVRAGRGQWRVGLNYRGKPVEATCDLGQEPPRPGAVVAVDLDPARVVTISDPKA